MRTRAPAAGPRCSGPGTRRSILGRPASEIAAFFSDLATHGHVSASTQNQALSTLLFLYREVLGRKIEGRDQVVHARRPVRPPTVLAQAEEEKRVMSRNVAQGCGLAARLFAGYPDTTPDWRGDRDRVVGYW